MGAVDAESECFDAGLTLYFRGGGACRTGGAHGADLAVPRPSPQRDRAQVENGAGSVSNALRMARANVGSW